MRPCDGTACVNDADHVKSCHRHDDANKGKNSSSCNNKSDADHAKAVTVMPMQTTEKIQSATITHRVSWVYFKPSIQIQHNLKHM